MTVIELNPADETTVECPDCPATFTGPATGRGSAVFKLGTHRFREHGYRSPKRGAKRSSTRPTDDDFAATPIIATVRDIAEGARGGKSTPTAAQLTDAFGRGLGLTSIAVASFAVETDPNIPEGPAGEALRDHLVDELSLTQKAAEDVMRPLAKAFADTGLNKKYGRTIVENVDVVASIAELGKLGLNWKRYFRERAAATNAAGPPPVVAAFASVAAPPVAEGAQSPPPQNGVVLGANEEAMRAAQVAMQNGAL